MSIVPARPLVLSLNSPP